MATTPQTTYFGDVVTTGNTLISGTAAFQGTFANFVSNIGCVNQSTSIGSSGVPVGSLYGNTANIGNVTMTNFVSNIGIGTAPTGNALNIPGNLYASTSVGAPNVFVTLANASALNVSSIFTKNSFLGIGTTNPSGTSLLIPGNVFASYGFGGGSIFATNSNATVDNLKSLWVTSNVGIGTAPGGTPLTIQGNFYASNTISTGVVNAATSANIAVLNVSSIFNQNSVSINVNGASGTALYVQGSVLVSNSVQDINISASTMSSSLTNTFTLGDVSNAGIGTTPALGGATLAVQGNAYISNGLTTPQVFTGTWYSSGVSNTTSVVATSNVGIGGVSAANLTVTGNVFVSNAVTTGNLFSQTANVPTLNVTTMNGPMGISGPATGNTISIYGNVYVSNSLQTTNLIATYPNFTSINVTSITVSNISIGYGTSGPAGLVTKGNAFVSNSVTSNTVIANISNITTMNVLSILNQNVSVGTLTTSGTSLYVQGNVAVSLPISALNVQSTTMNISSISNINSLFTKSIGNTGNTLNITGNAYISNGIQSNNFFTNTANVPTLNVVSIFSQNSTLGIGTTNPSGTSVYVYGNVYASIDVEASNIVSPNGNITGNATTLNLIVNSNIGSANTTLFIAGNAFATTSFATINVSATTVNITTLNVLSIFSQNSTLGIGTTNPSGTSLYIPGNIFGTSLTTGVLFGTSENTSRLVNAFSLTTPTAVVGSLSSGYTLQIGGNLYVSNAITLPSVNATTAQAVTSNIGSITQVAGTVLNFTGNALVSNAVTTTNVLATTMSASAQTNTSSIVSAYIDFNFPALWAYFPLQSSLNNASGLVNVGGITGSYVRGPGPGTTYSLVGQTVTFNILNNLYVDPGMTVSMWVLGSSSTTILSMNGSYQTGQLTIGLNGGNYVFTYVPLSTIYNAQTSVAPVIGAWTHLCVTLVAGQMIFYINGASAATNSFVPNGTYLTGTSTMYSSSGLTDVRIYSQALSPGQVQNLYLTGGLSTPSAVQVFGNVYTSNVNFSTGNIIAVNANVTTLNVSSLLFAGIGTSIASRNSLYVVGNVYVSNSINVTNLIVSTMNSSTLNTASLTMNVLVVTSLGWSNSNIFISNSISTTNFTANGTIIYGEDLTKRSIHLLPNPSNASFIQAWISATCNASSQTSKAWWDTSPAPLYSDIAGGTTGQSDYSGSVYLPDGRVLFVPYNASNVGVFNPASSLFTSVGTPGLDTTAGKFRGGVLLPSGNVVFVPASSSNAGMFNPLTYAYSNVTAASGFGGGVLAPNGNVVFIPNTCANIGQLNPTSLVYSNVTATGVIGATGGVLIPNGNVVTGGSSNICMYNTTTNPPVFSNIVSSVLQSPVLAPNGNVILFSPNSGLASFNPTTLAVSTFTGFAMSASGGGAVLLPSGNIVYNAISSINMIDPSALVSSIIINFPTAGLFSGATLVPSGQVVFCPSGSANVGVLDTFTLAPQEMCLSPYFNKF